MIFQKCTKSHEELPKRHKITGETSKYAQNQARIFQKCTRSQRSWWDFVHIWKFLLGFCAYLEVSHGILCIFGSSSYNFVHFWKFLMKFCAFLEVPRRILCIFGRSWWDFVHGTSKMYTIL
jgi:hypothetical protein